MILLYFSRWKLYIFREIKLDENGLFLPNNRQFDFKTQSQKWRNVTPSLIFYSQFDYFGQVHFQKWSENFSFRSEKIFFIKFEKNKIEIEKNAEPSLRKNIFN